MREACAEVARRARFVGIDEPALERYAEQLSADEVDTTEGPRLPGDSDPELRCAFVLTLDAVNFGSGWFPELRKRPGHSGYRTIEAVLIERFDRAGPLGAAELSAVTPAACADLFGQGLASPAVAELMGLFARAWRELGERVAGPFLPFVSECRGSAAALVARLLDLPMFRDACYYEGQLVPLFKRAQLAVADLHAALPDGAGRFDDLDELTLFADNLVPHVLRLDGVLRVESGLVERIERGELLQPGSPEEVELRAVAVHAVECLAALSAIPPRRLDFWLWTRGAAPQYKARPRHRCRCTFY